jgi:hypothetical protein
VLGPRYPNLDSVVVQATKANNNQHSLLLDAGLIAVGYYFMSKDRPSL